MGLSEQRFEAEWRTPCPSGLSRGGVAFATSLAMLLCPLAWVCPAAAQGSPLNRPSQGVPPATSPAEASNAGPGRAPDVPRPGGRPPTPASVSDTEFRALLRSHSGGPVPVSASPAPAAAIQRSEVGGVGVLSNRATAAPPAVRVPKVKEPSAPPTAAAHHYEAPTEPLLTAAPRATTPAPRERSVLRAAARTEPSPHVPTWLSSVWPLAAVPITCLGLAVVVVFRRRST